MIHKTDARYFTKQRKWARGWASDEEIVVIIRREVWWLFGVIPMYCRDTLLESL